jgi:hypothetical protein
LFVVNHTLFATEEEETEREGQKKEDDSDKGQKQVSRAASAPDS